MAWARVVTVATAVVAADWFSKRAIESSIRPGEERRFLPGVQLVDTRNHGVAFGMLPKAQVFVTVALAVVVVAVLIYFVRRSGRGLIWLPTGMLLGGALGNIIDRLRDGAVTDFIKLPLGWPPFNLADTSITLGVIVLVLLVGGVEHGGSDASPEEGRPRPEGTPDSDGAQRRAGAPTGDPPAGSAGLYGGNGMAGGSGRR